MNHSEQPDNNASVNHELVLETEIEGLPEDLRNVWMMRYEAVENETELLAFFEEFRTFKGKRREALDSSALEVHQEAVDPDIRRQILLVHDSIKQSFGRVDTFLGNGASAEVYLLEVAPSLCVKYITNQDAYNDNNHLRTEYSFLDKLHSFSHEGIRSPRPYFIRIHPAEGHAYGMERIQGENLSRLLEEPEKNIDLIALVKTLDPKVVEQNLVAYIQELQNQFGISHNDLFRRNIMVDRQGNFYVIDFGKAQVEEIGEDHEMKFKSDIAAAVSSIRGFFEAIDKISVDYIMIEETN